jgi:RimJ/RimL family protein N-acetyltransferase
MGSFADKPTLVGNRVVLRPIVGSDADAMWAELADAEANRLTGTHTEFGYEQIRRWAATRVDTDDRLDLAATDPVTRAYLGEVVINEWDPANRSCSFRIALGAHARDRGVGTESTQLLIDYVFGEIDDPPVNRIELEVYAFNPRAQRVYEKVGFVLEGVRREALRWDDAYTDAVVMSILRSDWAGRRRR